MTWSDKKPTQEGWYWMKSDQLGPSIVQLFVYDGKLTCFIGRKLQVVREMRALDTGLCWAGPIPEPQERGTS